MFQFIMSQVGPEQVLLFKAVRAKHTYKASHAAWYEHKPFTFCPNIYTEFAALAAPNSCLQHKVIGLV